MLTGEVWLFTAQSSYGDGTLALVKPDHRGHRVLRRNRYTHMHMVRHQVPSQNLALFLPSHSVNELMVQIQNRDVAYWGDKHGHEVDFVLARPRTKPLAIECKWSADNFDPANLRAFRQQLPEGEDFVIAQDVERAFSQNYQDLRVRFVGLNALIGSVLE
jgi:hypothetical protein